MKFPYLAAIVLAAPIVSNASVFYQTSFTFNLTSFPSSITNMVAIETPGEPYGARMNYLGPDSGIAAGGAITTLSNPFLNQDDPRTVALLIGIATNLPNDAEGQKHIVFGISSDAAAVTTGISWGAFFPDTNEDQLIADLELGTSGGLNWGNDFLTLAPGLQNVAAFLNTLGSPGGFLSGDSYVSGFFNLPAPEAAATDFTIVAFSDGQTVGSGTATQSTLDFGGSDTPEPSMFLPGLLAVAGAFAWRRKLR